MSRYLSIHKIPFACTALGLVAMCWFGFVTYRPNRIAAGEAVYIWQLNGDVWVVILALWVAILLLSLFNVLPSRAVSISFLASTLLLLIIAAVGRYAAITAEEAGTIARISLGPAFWTCLFCVVAIQTDVWQRSGSAAPVISMIFLITGSVVLWLLISGKLDMLSIMREFANRRERFYDESLMHLKLAGSSVGMALVLGIPLGHLAHRKKQLYGPTFFTLNTLQTIPSLALFGILIPLLATVTQKLPVLTDLGIRGIGAAPAIIALTVYSLLPIARNTYTGFATVDPAAVEAGIGMGMTPSQLLWRVEMPIASPVILNGVRIALVQAIGLTAVAALIGAGGLGVFIFQGLGQAANDLILLGAIPTIFIAVILDSVMGGVTLILQPKGLR